MEYGNIKNFQVSELSDEEKTKMFDMYVLSYSLGGQQLWFKTKEQLFERYPCVVTFNNDYLTVYAMVQFRKNFNKISLVCHDGSVGGKELSIKLRLVLVNQKGWMLEAADKVSWLLRKNNAPIISDYDSIVKALDIENNPHDRIDINKSFDYGDKMSFFYTRIFDDLKNEKTYYSKETLFGTEGCLFNDTTNCDRTCRVNPGVKIGGTRKWGYGMKHYTRKVKKTKRKIKKLRKTNRK